MDPRPPDPARRGHRTRPIEAYGLIGDTRTAALVSDAGAIDWMCVPRFDGGPLFGREQARFSSGRSREGRPAAGATSRTRRR
jgi:GH15 family glucan-1,4-alpha-glucosidase